MTFTDRLALAWHVLTGSSGAKAMADLHPELLEREHLATLRSETLVSATPYSYLSALGDHAAHVWVRKAVTVVMNSFAPLPLAVIRDNKAVEGGHAVTDLLNHVNDQMSPIDLWQQWVVDMLLGGEEGWELTLNGRGQYLEIFPRQPHTISIVPDRERARYFQVAEYVIDDAGGTKPYALPPDEMALFKFFNPRNPWRGLAPVSAVRLAILIDTYAQVWAKLFFNKGARPDYAVISPEGTTRSEREEMELKLAAKFGGSDNWFRPVVLEKGVTDIKPLDFKPRDLEWLSQRQMARDEIGAIFGVPDEIMGYGRDTYENFETAHWVLWTLTILPLCGLRDTHLTKFFRRVNLLKPNERLLTDTSQVAALKKDLKDKIEAVVRLCERGAPFNLASQHIGLGLTIPGGDIGYLPANLVPVGTPPPPPAAGVNGRVLSPTPTPAKHLSKPRHKTIAYGSIEHRALWEAFTKRAETHAHTLGNAVTGLLEAQQAEVLDRLKFSEGGKSAWSVLSKTEYWAKSPQEVAANPFDRSEWEKQFRDEVKPILRNAIAEAGADALAELAVEIAFAVDAPAVAEFLNERNQRFAEHVNETTWTQLQESLTEGLDNGESLSDLAERVKSVMGARIRSSEEVIARTEIIGCLNGGVLQAWKQSDVVAGKEWISALDNRVRETHAEAHGQMVGIDDEFTVGACAGQSPGDTGCAEEDIQCRCTMAAVLDTKAFARFMSSITNSANGHGKMKVIS